MLTKKRIDTGIRNNPSTGDVLADGGDKINNNFDDVYNKFADKRLFEIGMGVDTQVIHATGYFQKYQPIYYTQVVEMGSKHDIDTTLGTINFRLPKVKVGESIQIINANGSINSEKSLVLQCNTSDSFVDGEKNKTIRSPNIHITLWGVADINGAGRWDYSIDDMYRKTRSSVNEELTLHTLGNTIILGNIDDFDVMKLLVYYNDAIKSITKSSEIMVHVNSELKEVFHTEYGIVSNTKEETFNLSFSVEEDIIRLRIVPISGNNSRFKIKSIETL